jgi:hypothetical protein
VYKGGYAVNAVFYHEKRHSLNFYSTATGDRLWLFEEHPGESPMVRWI